MHEKTFTIRCRGIIMHERKLLVVRHPGNITHAALPGGHLEWGEDVRECIRREIVEELGVEPAIGRLLYINNFTEGDLQSVEFLFEIKNGGDYVGCEERVRSHAHEIAEIRWVDGADEIRILPRQVAEDFRAGNLLHPEVRYVS